jgi:hypothetical protein
MNEDEDKLAASIARGHRAEALLSDSIIVDAFAAFERDCIEYWKATPRLETPHREAIWQAIQVAQKVHAALHDAAVNGRVSQHQLDALVGKTKE